MAMAFAPQRLQACNASVSGAMDDEESSQAGAWYTTEEGVEGTHGGPSRYRVHRDDDGSSKPFLSGAGVNAGGIWVSFLIDPPDSFGDRARLVCS